MPAASHWVFFTRKISAKLLSYSYFLYFCNKFFGGLEGRNIMFRYLYGNILLDIPADLGCPFLGNKGSKTADIDVFALGQRFLDFLEHRFQGNQNIYFWDTGLFRNLIDQICFSHSKVVL